MQMESQEFLRIIESPYWRAEDAEVVVAAWRASGESMSAFVECWQLHASRIGRWKKRLETGQDGEPVDFLPVRVVDPSPAAARPVEPSRWVAELARGGWTVHVPTGFEGNELARLLLVVEEVQPC